MEYSFTNTTQFNTTFSPEEFGLYELCFQDEECGIDHCFEVEVNLPPTIAFNGDSLLLTCDEVDQLSLDLEVDVTDPAGVAIINWPFPGNDNVLENEYTFSQYATGIYEVTATNGCGEAADQVVYTAIPEPLLENDYLCGEGATLELDPIAGDQNSGLVYEWTYNGNEVDDVNDNEWEVNATGSYCVTVPDEGCPNNFDESDCAFIDIVTAIDIDVFLGGSITDCDGGGIEPGEDANLSVNPAFAANYADYTITWPDGTATTVEENFEWVIPEESELNGTQICVTIEDPYGCEPQEACGLIFIGDDPTWDPSDLRRRSCSVPRTAGNLRPERGFQWSAVQQLLLDRAVHRHVGGVALPECGGSRGRDVPSELLGIRFDAFGPNLQPLFATRPPARIQRDCGAMRNLAPQRLYAA